VLPASAHTVQPVRIVIRGDHFNLFGERHLGRGTALDAAFQATLGGVALADVRWVDNQTLAAVVPAGLAGEALDLVLDGPTGHAVLPGAFRASATRPASLAVTAVAPAQVESASPFGVTVTIANTGGTRVNHVQPVLSGSGISASDLSSDLAIEPGASTTFVYLASASVRGFADLAVTATGVDDFSGDRVGAASATGLEVLAAPALLAIPRPPPVTVSVGQQFTLSVDVSNAGDVAAEAFWMSAPVPGGAGAATPLDSGPLPQTIAGGQTITYSWTFLATARGELAFDCAGTGNDGMSGVPATVSTSWPAILVQTPAALTAAIVLPPPLAVGDLTTLQLDVANEGDATARAVVPSLDMSGTGLSILSLSTPGPVDIPGHQTRGFVWQLSAVSAGSSTVSLQARGTDANTGAGVQSAIETASISTASSVVTLAGILISPPGALPAETFTASFTVTNTGTRAVDFLSPSLVTDSSAVSIQSPPVAPGASLLPGESATYSWTLVAGASGSANLTATVQGTARGTGTPLSASAVASLAVGEAAIVARQPFEDNSIFASLFAFHGYLYAGPNGAGTGGARMQPDGTRREAVVFTINGDVTGSRNTNTAPAPFPSFGATGCQANTLACGPDNESGRGFLGAVSFLGGEWMIGSGALASGSLFRFYLSSDATTSPDFSYVDMSGVPVPDGMRMVTAAAVLGSKLYVGFGGLAASRPGLVALSRAPAAPGLDAGPADLLDLKASAFPAIGRAAKTTLLDSLLVFDGSLYAFDSGGCARSTTADPTQGGWTDCTPSSVAYPAKISRTTGKSGNLLPADKAFPAVAIWNGRLYAARNTTAGPQLWMCDPGADGQCAPGEWKLIAANTRLDSNLSQFDDTGNGTISLLAATSSHLYVGFDNAAGVQLYRAQTATPINQGDFAGAAGCNAAQHATGCAGIGGSGLGAGATRFFDGKALSFPSGEQLFVAAGDGATSARLFRFAQ
jgi:hypothetical protein